MGPVVGVLGASGGVGASAFAAVAAAVAAAVPSGAGPAGSLLVDLDVAGGGIDVLLGIEAVAGARWSGVRVAGGHLDPAALLDGLPRWGPAAVLAADVAELDGDAVREVIRAAAEVGTVVLDLPRATCPERAAALLHCDLLVVLARGDVAGLVAAHAAVSALPELPAGVVVRRGDVPAGAAAAVVGAQLLGELPATGGGRFALDPHRPPRAAARVAAGVLRGLAAEPVGRGPGTKPVGRHAARAGLR